MIDSLEKSKVLKEDTLLWHSVYRVSFYATLTCKVGSSAGFMSNLSSLSYLVLQTVGYKSKALDFEQNKRYFLILKICYNPAP